MRTLIDLGWLVFSVALVLCLGQRAQKQSKAPPICDTCRCLKQKRQRSVSYYRYKCSKFGGFDKPPEICEQYDPKVWPADEDER